MRLWSLHPNYLDAKGLVALWREALLAQSVLLGNTKGYKNHPQLQRFKNSREPLGAIGFYLAVVGDEADRRGYKFNKNKIVANRNKSPLPVTSGQIEFECKHLASKLLKRHQESFKQLDAAGKIKIHPLFKEIEGDIEDWERN